MPPVDGYFCRVCNTLIDPAKVDIKTLTHVAQPKPGCIPCQKLQNVRHKVVRTLLTIKPVTPLSTP